VGWGERWEVEEELAHGPTLLVRITNYAFRFFLFLMSKTGPRLKIDWD
jgi:hypothetical protein